MSGEILFFDVADPGYLPLVRAVERLGFAPILNTTPLAQQMHAAGVPFRAFEEFAPPDFQARVNREIARIGDGLARSFRSPEARRAFQSPVGDLMPHLGRQFFPKLLGMLGTEILVLEIASALFERLDLRLIVMGGDNSHTQRVLVMYARTRGIPTLQLAHGMYARPVVRTAGSVEAPYAQFMTAFGSRIRDLFIALGNSPDQVFVTGAPLWDQLYRPEARPGKVEARRRLGLDPDRPLLLFCTRYADGSSAPFPARSRRLIEVHRAMLAAMEKVGPRAQLAVRPHPHELRRFALAPEEENWVVQAYQSWLSRGGSSEARLLREQKAAAIRAADVVVVVGSSTITPEAMILERPVVLVPYLKEESTLYGEHDGVVVGDESQLGDILADLLAHPEQQAAMVERQHAVLPELNHGNDGRATERVAALIEELALKTVSRAR